MFDYQSGVWWNKRFWAGHPRFDLDSCVGGRGWTTKHVCRTWARNIPPPKENLGVVLAQFRSLGDICSIIYTWIIGGGGDYLHFRWLNPKFEDCWNRLSLMITIPFNEHRPCQIRGFRRLLFPPRKNKQGKPINRYPANGIVTHNYFFN